MANQALRHIYTDAQEQEIIATNKKVVGESFLDTLIFKYKGLKENVPDFIVPFAEFGNAGYVVFSDGTDYESAEVKRKIAQHLPEDMTLVVFTGKKSKFYQESVFELYSKYIDSSRLKIVYLPDGQKGFWARDALPVPVWKTTTSEDFRFYVVDARYYHKFESDLELSQYFNAGLLKHNFYYEGGNHLANSLGDCIVVDNPKVQMIPDFVFLNNYGCKKTIRLPNIKGIGHVDESVKFMSDTTVLVDDDTYAKILTQYGYTVVRMVRPHNKYETYINALVVNGTAFVPVFGQKTDSAALAIYEKFGLKTIGLNSVVLSNEGLGSVHCITMSYPPVPFKEFLLQTGAKELINHD